ncbi:hypothetical protein E6O75_ATG06387 [Venturia nashicola]|uniref:Uncharacterized protein n=1 Tax=Venturia nashicola TaxID=86259 RepID=A0A4Z1NRJ3_9PEZI|nr:hypothetical protein E6O75_ATG06387 [Venturia nashicola]
MLNPSSEEVKFTVGEEDEATVRRDPSQFPTVAREFARRPLGEKQPATKRPRMSFWNGSSLPQVNAA